jgi:hypothetical protein
VAVLSGREHNQLENTLEAPPQFEVNYLNANLIALSFIFTYPSYLFLSGMISTGCHAQHRNIYCNQLLPDEG